MVTRSANSAACKGLHTLPYEEAELEGQQLNEEAEAAARKKGRSARFAVQVVSRYKFTCALTGLCCLTMDGAAIVDAAHIEPFAENQNDDIEKARRTLSEAVERKPTNRAAKPDPIESNLYETKQIVWMLKVGR